MRSAHWHLTYSGGLASEPVLWELSQRFGLRTNIRRANIEAELGWVIVEVHGSDDALAKAKVWLAERGVQIAELPEG